MFASSEDEALYRDLCEIQDPTSRRSQLYKAALAKAAAQGSLHVETLQQFGHPDKLKYEKFKLLLRGRTGGKEHIEINCNGEAGYVCNYTLPELHQCDENKMRSLLKSRADPNELCPYGQVPLHRAAFCGHVGKVVLLLHARANINAKTSDDRTPLHKAVAARPEHRNLDVIRLLLKARAEIDALSGAANPLPRKHFESPLHIAAAHGFDEASKLLIKAGADINLRTGSGHTALDLAKGDGSSWLSEKRDPRGAMAVRQHIAALLERVRTDSTDAIALAKLSEALPASESVSLGEQEHNSDSLFHLALDVASVRARDENWFGRTDIDEGLAPQPSPVVDVADRLRQIADANPDFGAKRIREFLRKEGHSISLQRSRELLAEFRDRAAQTGGSDRAMAQPMMHGDVDEKTNPGAVSGDDIPQEIGQSSERMEFSMAAPPMSDETISLRHELAARGVVCRAANRDYEPEVAHAVEDANQRGQCVICLEREARFVMQACSHLVYCKPCCITAALMARDRAARMPTQLAKRKLSMDRLQRTQMECAICRTSTMPIERSRFRDHIIVCDELDL